MTVAAQDKIYIINTIKKYFPSAKIMAFGSRIRSDHKKFSDLDLCLNDSIPLPLAKWCKLEEEFSNSNLLYKVDLCDWHRISKDFQQIIAQTCETWQ
ncbi:MAG: nucleotidyltransferase domain-containing protein [Oligoflexia bacterium]|nr:nucleotidyltransferase domain-containing protein [Oligoflexia bacterium]